MPKYTVYLLLPANEWEDVEAESEDEAISKCHLEKWVDINEPHHFIAWEQDQE